MEIHFVFEVFGSGEAFNGFFGTFDLLKVLFTEKIFLYENVFFLAVFKSQ